MVDWLSVEMRLVFVAGLYVLLNLFEGLVPLFRFRQRRLRRTLPNLGLTGLVLLTNLALSFFRSGTDCFEPIRIPGTF
jgi:hypothetical protein